jgi:hypothetical protein
MPSTDERPTSRTGCKGRCVARSVAQRRLNCRSAALLATTALIALSTPAQAAVRTWISPFVGDWADNSNWNPGSEPTAADDAVIGRDGRAQVTTSGDTARSLTLGQSDGSGTVNIFAPGLLTVNSLANSSIILGPSTGSSGTLNIGSINPPAGGAQQPKISSWVKAGLECSQSKTAGR